MRMIDVRCTACGHSFEYLKRTRDGQDDPPAPPPCESCGGVVETWSPPPRVYGAPDPVVIFRGPDGFRFPGDPNGPAATRYAREGFERIELRGAADVRRFEKVMNAHEYSRAARRVEHQQRFREQREAHLRGELRQKMQSFSARGRELARVVMRQNDHKPRERVRDANFHVEVYSVDRSNRDASRDAQGRRRRD